PAGLPDRVDHTDRGALVRAEETVEVRIAFKDRRGEVRRLEVVAGAVLDVDDLDVGSVFLDVLDEAIAPVDAGDARLIVDDGRHLALTADQLDELLGSVRSGGDVVGGGRGQRNLAVDARVEGDDRDAPLCSLV